MKTYNFDEMIKRAGTGCVKWDRPFETQAEKIYPLWVADMDFACSDAIIEALHKRVDECIYGYSTGLDDTYKKAVCGWFKKRFNWSVDPNSIFYAGGVVPAIAYLLEILSNEQDGIIIQTPVYYPFRKKIEATNRVVVENPLINHDGYYTMDFDGLDELMKRDDVKGMILCSPHNPVGRVWSKAELLRVVEIAKRYHKWIISDEIHGDIIRVQHTHLPLAALAPDYVHNIITCTAPSKTFNLAGLQNSNIMIEDPAKQEAWKRFVWDRLSLSSPNVFALSATIAAYTKGEEWLDQLNAYIDENIKEATLYLKKHLPKAVVSPSEGTYLLWVDVNAYCNDIYKLEEVMLKHGIILDEGYLFGHQGNGFERINTACPRSLLMECMEEFVKAVKEL